MLRQALGCLAFVWKLMCKLLLPFQALANLTHLSLSSEVLFGSFIASCSQGKASLVGKGSSETPCASGATAEPLAPILF